ncbi:MAG: FGGY-family carbohydrate kinase [Coprobacillus sp.]|nr:FGGY-family carbohydrate kinase [Coprobacillus sp.]
MSKNPLALVFDFGTQSVRTTLVDKDGNIVGIVKTHYEPAYYTKEKGYAEQSPDFYWNVCLESLAKLKEEHGKLFKDVVGCTITTFRDTAVLLDKDLKPLRDCILWLDERVTKNPPKSPLLYRALFSLIGMTDTIELNKRRTVAQWVKENEPDIWAKTYKYVHISTYFTYLLTGELKDSAASVMGHYPIDFKKREWYKSDNNLKGHLYGVPLSMCPELVQPGEVVSYVKDEICEQFGLPKHLPVYATGSDKANETVGLAALDRDTAAVSYGTASTIEVSNKKYLEFETFLPAYPAALPGMYNMDLQVYRGYWMLKWFSNEFASEDITAAELNSMAVEEVLNEKLLQIAPGSDGLILQPYWGPSLKRPLMKGSIIGFTSVHTKYHLYRAIIEGIAYALREGLEGMEKKQNHKVSVIRISGGGAQSSAICQITSDIFGLNVQRVQTFETTSLGAGMCVMLATGVYKSYEEACEKMVRIKDEFTPNWENHKEYDYLYKTGYLNLYPQLKSVYKKLNKHDTKNEK